MQSNQLKGIYLHGYQGFVTEEKKAFLESFGDVYAPKVDYDNEPTLLFDLYQHFKNKDLDFVSGTSLGGILIYHLAILLEKPCLLLNPAVTALEQIKPYIPQEALVKEPLQKVVVLIGEKDEVVDPIIQQSFFQKINDATSNVELILDGDLEHFVPYDKFEESFKTFKKYL